MPIPVIPDHYQAQVIFSGHSGLGEDVFTNTLHFRNDNIVGDAEEVADRLADDLAEFYGAAPTGVPSPVSIASRLSSLTVGSDITVKVYDLGLAAPRFPHIRTRSLTGLSATAMVSEAAVCLSLVASQNTARNRGRIFIGPLGTGAGTVNANGFRPHPGFCQSILGSYARLAGKAEHTPCVYSPTDNQMKPLTGAWVDDAFDTQRRRGLDATTRWVFGEYLGKKGVPYNNP